MIALLFTCGWTHVRVVSDILLLPAAACGGWQAEAHFARVTMTKSLRVLVLYAAVKVEGRQQRAALAASRTARFSLLVLQRWCAYSTRRRVLRALLRDATRGRIVGLLVDVFHRWRGVMAAKRQVRLRVAVQVAGHMERLMRRVMASWAGQTVVARFLTAVRAAGRLRMMARCFGRWRRVAANRFNVRNAARQFVGWQIQRTRQVMRQSRRRGCNGICCCCCCCCCCCWSGERGGESRGKGRAEHSHCTMQRV